MPKLRGFEYYPDTGTVNVDFNMDQNLTTDLTRDSLKQEMSDIYIALFNQSNIQLNTVSVMAWGPFQDQYGNTSYQRAVGAKLTNDVASKINWSLDTASLELNIIPGLWQVFLGNASLGLPQRGSALT